MKSSKESCSNWIEYATALQFCFNYFFFSFTINQQDSFLFTVVGNAFVMSNVILTEKYNNQIYKVYSHLKSKTIETVQF